MIVIDTNVLSELMRPSPDPRVVAWIAQVMPGEATTTAITMAEIDQGIQRLPRGRRRAGLEEIFRSLLVDIAHDVLPFDREVAGHYALISRRRETAGRPIDQLDCMIAAICASRAATLATRNERDFEGTGIRVTNPWTA